MSKISLIDLVNLENQTTAVNGLNANNATLKTALTNTLSRDGTSPNQMGATLDMNSNHIINLPAPGSTHEPLRLGDLTTIANSGLVAIPTGTVLGNYSGASAVPSPQYFALGDTLQYETRALVTAQTILVNVPRIKIARYATGYPLCNTTYIQGTSAGPAAIQSLNGIWWEIDLSSGEAYPESFGAKGDGTTDDVIAINACITALNTAGGGTMRPRAKTTYLLGSLSSDGLSCLLPKSNVNIIGGGWSTVFKLKSGVNTPSQFYFIMYSTTPNVLNDALFSNFTIDFNGLNNLGGSTLNLTYAIGCDDGNNVVVDKVKVINNPGTVSLSFGRNVTPPKAKNIRITNCYFSNSGDNINPGCTDHSTIHVTASNCVIANNTMDNGAKLYGTGIEIHGEGVVASGNSITDYSGGFNIANELSVPSYQLSVIGNTIKNVKYGVGVFGRTLVDLGDIIISNNNIYIDPTVASSGIDASANISSGANALNISIINNTISAFGLVPSATSTYTGILLGAFASIDCSGNQIYNTQGPGIWRYSLNRSGNVIKIDRNLIYNPGLGSVSSGAFKLGIEVDTDASSASNISIQGNSIVTVGGSINYGISGALNSTGGLISGNTVIGATVANINWTGTGMSTGITSTTAATTTNFTVVNGIVTRL